MKTLKIAGGVIIGAGLLGSCVDSNYDIVDADISKDIAIFDNGISLPVGDVDTMKIGELLNLDDSEMIEEDASSGEYCLVRHDRSQLRHKGGRIIDKHRGYGCQSHRLSGKQPVCRL